jgi:protein involved in sex pheromone biosynthesis
MKEGSIVFDGVKESLFVHEKFNEFSLDYPVTIKLSQFLTKKLNKQFHSSDDMQLFINQLEEASHE